MAAATSHDTPYIDATIPQNGPDLKQSFYVNYHPHGWTLNPYRRTNFDLVVRIDGACRNNGKPTARASWGVYFGPGSQWNRCDRLPANLTQTSTRAEIEALVQAMRLIREINQVLDPGLGFHHVYILSDSEYLVKSMTLWMKTWLRMGGRKANGGPVMHWSLLKELHEQLEDFRGEVNDPCVLWHIPRESNKEADALANQAFDNPIPNPGSDTPSLGVLREGRPVMTGGSGSGSH